MIPIFGKAPKATSGLQIPVQKKNAYRGSAQLWFLFLPCTLHLVTEITRHLLIHRSTAGSGNLVQNWQIWLKSMRQCVCCFVQGLRVQNCLLSCIQNKNISCGYIFKILEKDGYNIKMRIFFGYGYISLNIQKHTNGLLRCEKHTFSLPRNSHFL